MHAQNQSVLPGQPGESPFPSTTAPLVYVVEELQWEYKRIECLLNDQAAPTEGDLNALGEEGWELVGILTYRDRVYLYFKRLVE